MDHIEEKLQVLDELLRKAYSLISPLDIYSDLKWYLKRDLRKAQMEKFPKCFIVIKNKMGRDIPFPICNVMGMTDPRMVSFSLKLADALKDKPDIEADRLSRCIHTLRRLYARFNKDVPTPAPEAARKATTTKSFNAIAKYLQGLK